MVAAVVLLAAAVAFAIFVAGFFAQPLDERLGLLHEEIGVEDEELLQRDRGYRALVAS